MPNIVEFQLPLPLSLEEYRIAQLFMVARFSREHSEQEAALNSTASNNSIKDSKSNLQEGVEVLVNEPFEADSAKGFEHGGMFTHKIIHLGRNIPGWLRAVLPASALQVHEKAWNAFPHFSKNEYSSPLLGDRFKLDLDTRYAGDDVCSNPNALDLSRSELRQRTIDVVDIVSDRFPDAKYNREQDPKIFKSETTSRGPLDDSWLSRAKEFAREESSASAKSAFGCIGIGTKDVKHVSSTAAHPTMTVYKLSTCKCKLFGLGGRAERWVQNAFVREILLVGHRLAYATIDEWHGMTMDDIRQYEDETQEFLHKLRHGGKSDDGDDDGGDDNTTTDEKGDDEVESIDDDTFADSGKRDGKDDRKGADSE